MAGACGRINSIRIKCSIADANRTVVGLHRTNISSDVLYRLEYWYFCPLLLLHFQANILQLTLSSHLLQRYAIGMTAAQSATKLIFYLACLWPGSLTLKLVILADTFGYALLYAGTRFAYVRFCRPPSSKTKFRVEPAERRRLLRYGFYNNFNDAGTLILSGE